uniref:Uncharacterized protein n=1 Tax=Magallana gigas TaxID=29159 RepID=K1QNF7_MAGGI
MRVNRVTMNHYKQYHSTEMPSVRLLKGRNRKLAKNGVKSFFISKKLDGYEFPVYSTEFCPRNQTEWKERSSAISCNESNGYLCLPNENITALLEFCYIHPFIWIQEG